MVWRMAARFPLGLFCNPLASPACGGKRCQLPPEFTMDDAVEEHREGVQSSLHEVGKRVSVATNQLSTLARAKVSEGLSGSRPPRPSLALAQLNPLVCSTVFGTPRGQQDRVLFCRDSVTNPPTEWRSLRIKSAFPLLVRWMG